MTQKSQEWFKQADYDMKTAEYLFKGRRYIYAVFMCHLSIEKALKGLYAKILKETPPKTHNLLFLAEKVKIQFPEDLYGFIYTLNGVSVPTRYPDELQSMHKEYNKAKIKNLINKGQEVLKWLKARL